MQVIPDQLRAARALLRLEQVELARRAHVSVATICRLEADGGSRVLSSGTLDGVCQVLEQAGAEFIPGGVRRRPPARPDASAMFEELRAISLRSAERLGSRGLLTDTDFYDEDGLPA